MTAASATLSSSPQPARASMLLAVALLLTAVAYIGTLRFDFVFDDAPQIVENAQLRSWHFVPGFFTHHLWAEVAPNQTGNFYRPLFLLWLLLNFKLFGLQPVGWHAATIAMHVLVTWLVFRLARRVLHQDVPAAVAALLFGVNPLHIETVAWISGVGDSLMAAPLLGALLCWMRFRDHRQRRWLAAALALAAVALLCKETAIVLPLLVALYEFFFFVASAPQRGGSRVRAALAAALPFLAVDAAYLVLRRLVLHQIAGHATEQPLSTVLLTAPSLLWFYLRHLVWPLGLSAFYDTPYVTAAEAKGFFLPLLAVAVAVLALWLAWRNASARSRQEGGALAFAAWWILIGLAPTLDVRVFQYGELAHDRYLYLPSVGFCLLLAYGLARIRPREPRLDETSGVPRAGRELFGQPVAAAVTLLAIVVFWGLATVSESVQWASTILLYTRAVQVAPNNPHAVQPLAMTMLSSGRLDEAMVLLQRASVLVPNDWTDHFLLGHGFYTRGRYAEAEQQLRRAIALDPNNAGQYYFLALSLMSQHRDAEAETPLRRAIALLPGGRGFHQALATVLAARGDRAGARAELETELRNDPRNAEARAQLAALTAR